MMEQPASSRFRFDGKVALVVGAASAIGEAAAVALAQSGAAVLCGDANAAGAQAVAGRISGAGGTAEALEIDITRDDSVAEAVASARRARGKIDVLVSTTAVNVRKRLLQYTEEEFDRVIGINLKGTFRLLRAVGAAMVETGGGSMIVTSSIRSLLVEPGQGVYAATKASLVQLARGFAVELAPHNIRVNAVAPGVVDTPLTAPIKKNPAWYGAYAEKSAMRRWAAPEEIAWPIVFLASPASSYITGTVLFDDGGCTAIDGRFEPPL
jgi:NAD(P)-dependent dehydrogenase (short-subunit alcohol dehydrogenase family)